VQLTNQELTAASSLVAVVAIVGGYLGIRSANRNALAIAKDTRAAQRKSDLDALKRIAYSGFLSALAKLADDQMKFDGATGTERKMLENYGSTQSTLLKRQTINLPS
jgi:hypothetical protein